MVERSFVGEAFLLSGLCDPGALQIYDFGYLPAAWRAQPPIPFQICELVNDGPLSSLVKRNGPLRPGEVVGVMLPICRALAELHRGGVVHLDVKPQNILLGRTAGRPFSKLADFGIAQRIGSTPSMSPSALLMYSVNWAAPEQLIGETVSPGCDVYSLALVTVYALTGRLVFQETDGVQGYRVRRFADQIIRDRWPAAGFRRRVLALMLDACSFEPESRLTDVQEFGRRLEAAFDAPGVVGGQRRGHDRRRPAGRAPPAIRCRDPAARPIVGRSHRGGAPVVAVARSPLSRGRRPPAAVPVPGGRGGRGAAGWLAPVRLSLLPAHAGRPGLHVKGLTCFVAAAGGRPSPAVTVHETTAVELRVSAGRVAGPGDDLVRRGRPQQERGHAGRPLPGDPRRGRRRPPGGHRRLRRRQHLLHRSGPELERAASETPRVAV